MTAPPLVEEHDWQRACALLGVDAAVLGAALTVPGRGRDTTIEPAVADTMAGLLGEVGLDLVGVRADTVRHPTTGVPIHAGWLQVRARRRWWAGPTAQVRVGLRLDAAAMRLDVSDLCAGTPGLVRGSRRVGNRAVRRLIALTGEHLPEWRWCRTGTAATEAARRQLVVRVAGVVDALVAWDGGNAERVLARRLDDPPSVLDNPGWWETVRDRPTDLHRTLGFLVHLFALADVARGGPSALGSLAGDWTGTLGELLAVAEAVQRRPKAPLDAV